MCQTIGQPVNNSLACEEEIASMQTEQVIKAVNSYSYICFQP